MMSLEADNEEKITVLYFCRGEKGTKNENKEVGEKY